MTCKKCGAVMEDSAKFCGFCGEIIEDISINNDNIIEETQTFSENISNPTTIEEASLETVPPQTLNNEQIDLEKTIVVSNETIQPDYNSFENNNDSMVENLDINQNSNENIAINTNENSQTIKKDDNLNNEFSTDTNSQTKKKASLMEKILVIGGLVVAISLIILVIVSHILVPKSSIDTLEKTVANFIEKSKKSLTTNFNVLAKIESGVELDFSGTIEAEWKNENEGLAAIQLEKSMLFDEIKVYGETNKEQFYLYAKSNLIDMLGLTSSEDEKWVKLTTSLEDITGEVIDDTYQNLELDIKKIIDEEHFIYVDKDNKLNHYQLIIDQKLIDNLKNELSKLNDEEVNDIVNSMEQLVSTDIKLDFYITNSNELKKVYVDLTNYLEEDAGISNLVMEIEFSKLGSTLVEIPGYVKNSSVDMETYMSENVKADDFSGDINITDM